MSRTPIYLRVTTLIIFLPLITACNLPSEQSPTPTLSSANQVLTAAAETVAAHLTSDPFGQLPTATTGEGTQPPGELTATSTPSETQEPSQTPTQDKPCDMAGFGADVTIPDGTKMSPGESFTKTWRLKNTGECTWDAGYDVVFDNGASMGGPASQQLTTGTVLPDASVDISIDMIAPGNTGTYRGDWKLRNPAGVIFGLGLNHQTFFVEIEVVEPTLSPTVTTESTTTHTPSPTTTPEPVIYSSGSLDVDQTFGADLDEGQIASGGVVDFYFQPVNVSTKYVTPLNGALFANWDPVLPSYTQCLNYSLSGADILVEPQLVGYYLCYQTSEGRPGFLHIETITSGDPQTINLNFTTYVAP